MADRKEVRVFISSPADCGDEREAAVRVLDEMNRTVGQREGLFFQAMRWEDVPPGLGQSPQTVIDECLGDYNVLVGLMWMRFGTPIPGGVTSGTEHEVQQAIERWIRVGEPRVMFYFKMDSPKDLSAIDPQQLQKVQDFRNRLQATALVQTFHGTSEFESKLRIHLNKLVSPLGRSVHLMPNVITDTPYDVFYKSFREVVGARRIKKTGAMLHVVFGSIADIREIPPVIPVGQSFDFWQRGPRSVLASFETIEVDGRPFFDDIEERWSTEDRPRAAGLGHAKYLILPKNSHALPGALFVVTTRDFSIDPNHYGYFINTPVEGIDYVIDCVIDAANAHRLSSIALPLLGTGYANIGRTFNQAALGQALREAVALLAVEKLENALRDEKSSLRRGVLVIYSQEPQGQEEHDLWEAITRFLGSRSEQRKIQIESSLMKIEKLTANPCYASDRS